MTRFSPLIRDGGRQTRLSRGIADSKRQRTSVRDDSILKRPVR